MYKKLLIRVLLAIVFLIIWSKVTKSFSEDDRNYYLNYLAILLAFIICYAYFSAVENFIKAEKIIYSIIFTVISLVISGLLTAKIMDGHDYEYAGLIENLIYYSTMNISLIIPAFLFLRFKKY